MKKIKRLKMVSFLVNIEDVTGKIGSSVMTISDEKEKEITINHEIQRIKDEFKDKMHYDEKVYSMHTGNKYYIYILKFFWIYQ